MITIFQNKFFKITSKKINEWFFGEVNLNSLIVCRIVFGLLIFFDYLIDYSIIESEFGPQGLPSVGARHDYLFFINITWLKFVSIEVVWVLYFLLLLSSISFAVGFKTKMAGVLTLILHSLFLARNNLCFSGWGYVIKPFIFYVLMSPAGQAYSIDAWLKRQHKKILLGVAWPLRLLQINICTVYGVASWARTNNISWIKGEMLYTILNSHIYSRFAIDWAPYKNILEVFALVAFGLELLAPILLWTRYSSRFIIAGLISMHFFVEIFTLVNGWSYMMIAALTSFVPLRIFKNKN